LAVTSALIAPLLAHVRAKAGLAYDVLCFGLGVFALAVGTREYPEDAPFFVVLAALLLPIFWANAWFWRTLASQVDVEAAELERARRLGRVGRPKALWGAKAPAERGRRPREA